MRHSILKHYSLYVCLVTALCALPGTALAQSVWNKVKDAAKQASQQGQRPQQPQQPGQQQPGQKLPKQGHAQQQAPGELDDCVGILKRYERDWRNEHAKGNGPQPCSAEYCPLTDRKLS